MVTTPTDDFQEILRGANFVGIVEDNKDPDKKQRCRIRIPFLHGSTQDIPTSALPWAQPKRDLNGLTCIIPDKGKVVNVQFPSADPYYPIYDSAEHLNINLQKKLESYSDDDYTNFQAILYDYNTQIYVDYQKGLFLRHKLQEINMYSDGIAINLKDNNSTLYLGDAKGNQENMLGTNFMQWFDTLMSTLMNAYIGNSGAPCIANPDLINVYAQYQAKRTTFLSQHVYVTDNNSINRDKIELTNQIGDKFNQTVHQTNITVSQHPEVSQPSNEERGLSDTNDYKPPIDDKKNKDENEGTVTSQMSQEVWKLSQYLKSKNFQVYDKQWQLNIVGIRNKLKDNGTITNRFDDWCYVFYLDGDNNWQLKKYNVTTTPGYAPGKNVLPMGPDNQGAATMAYGQYPNQYRLGYHQNRTGKPGGQLKKDGTLYPEHRALVGASTAYFRQLPGSDTYITQRDTTIKKGPIGLNIHNANQNNGNVYNYSEGCQVFKHKSHHDELISLCDTQVDKTGIGSFTYTLIPQDDYDNYTPPEQGQNT